MLGIKQTMEQLVSLVEQSIHSEALSRQSNRLKEGISSGEFPGSR